MVTTNDQIQVKTKTNRHQLYNVWMDVTSAQPGSKTVSAKVPGQPDYTSWRIPRSMVINTRPKGTNTAGTPVVPPREQPYVATQSMEDLLRRVAALEKTVEKLLLQNA